MSHRHLDLLAAVRKLFVLAPKPGSQNTGTADFWSIPLGGLHREHLQEAVTTLRRDRLRRDQPESEKRKLKATELYDRLAQTLGGEDYADWIRDGGQQARIVQWLADNGMHQPKDLIRWDRSPRLAGKLTARQVSDRLFNSTQPLPSRIFTGVGCKLFAPDCFGRLDLHQIARRLELRSYSDEDYLAMCLAHEDKVIAKAAPSDGSPGYLELTGRQAILNGLGEFIGCMYTLLGDNLCVPMHKPVFRSYNMSAEDRAFEQTLFGVFRREIEQTQEGWVDVLPMAGNENLIFLRGADGSFDWVVRDQRDVPFSANPLHPIFKFDEVPTAMLQPQLKAHIYFSRGVWEEELEHTAEVRHYDEGGVPANWPGYEKLVQRELAASRSYQRPRPPDGNAESGFVAHRHGEWRLMVSPLVTIEEFWRFYENTDWKDRRHAQARLRGMEIEEHLSPVNFLDGGDDPVSVTWLDAIAYCRHYERSTNLPVRLLEVDEWRQIAPHPTIALPAQPTLSRQVGSRVGLTPQSAERTSRHWCVVGGDERRGTQSEHRHKQGGTLRFSPDLPWSQNAQGLPFLATVDFGEWLSDHELTEACAANAATGLAFRGGPLERNRCPMWSTMKYKGLKTGFRLCYIAKLDA